MVISEFFFSVYFRSGKCSHVYFAEDCINSTIRESKCGVPDEVPEHLQQEEQEEEEEQEA
jgi:hypothetical protein